LTAVPTRAADESSPDAAELRRSAQRLAPWVHRTPVLTSQTLDARCGGRVFLKCENLQRAGAFKFRGAVNALAQLGDWGRAAGVVTHSSGNHAQAVALAGRLLGVPVCVVMPHTALAVKRAAAAGYGARIVSCGPTQQAREEAVATLADAHGYLPVHPYDDWRVIAGQATAAAELLEETGSLDLLLCPVGGGGLLAGAALAVQAAGARTRLVGVEPAAADDAQRSLRAGRIVPAGDPDTVADGLRTSLGVRPFAVIRRSVDALLTVAEGEILDALRFAWERLKLVIEPSAAVALAALLGGHTRATGRRVGMILTGGNVDLERLLPLLAGRRSAPTDPRDSGPLVNSSER
jgi:threonine dehydratase